MPTTKHLSYANITLPLTPSFIEDQWIKVVKDEYSFKVADFWNFDKPNVSALPTPSLPVPPDFKLDVLTWPTGANSPAWFHTIIETKRWNDISAACSPNGYNTPQPLSFFDGRTNQTTGVSKKIIAQMYIAGAARPLNQLGHDFSDLWLLTLTDQRFYWHYARTNIGTPLSWTNLYNGLVSALGITITLDTIDPAYGNPSIKWALAYQGSTPAILDAVANNVGQRVVVNLDGSVKTVNWETARTASFFYINNVNNVLIAGGLISEPSIGLYVPRSVQVLFPDNSNPPVSATPYVVTKTLTSLSISDYGGATGVPGYVHTLYADIYYDGSNASDCEAYAVQAATDWYGWRLTDTDLVYPGIEPWIPTGWEDCIEWTLKLIAQNPALPLSTNDDPYTKTQIRRGPWVEEPSGNFYQPGSSNTWNVTNYPTLHIQHEEDPDDPLPIPGPKGDIGPKSKDGINPPTIVLEPYDPEMPAVIPGPIGLRGYTGTGIIGPRGPDADEPELPSIVPGPIGLRGYTGTGIQGPPGPEGEEAEYTPIIPGQRGLRGYTGTGVIGPRGQDPEDPELPIIIPSPRGIQGFTGIGQIGPPGRDGEDDDKPIVQLITNISNGGSSSIVNGTFQTSSTVTIVSDVTLVSALSITLPSPGTYLILASLAVRGETSANIGWIQSYIYNQVVGLPISVGYNLGITQVAIEIISTITMYAIATFSTSLLVGVAAQRSSGPTWIVTDLNNVGQGTTGSSLSYIKLS